ncbi:ribonuclease HII [Anabaena cylindrica FACHB-243]|uniref:Ribonuclease HII n=1 Tax=Anabaena cylindrica (strain ATCC 27899 / PCC 7122) TaxID=272123 RepID=K9ZHV4_ANACC|nr:MULTISPECIES: ribonuclease HII [Anabaena]AFZ57930.1 RNase HII [Anabaena cylindrica PCC 7122]MBD2419714.1 ribonuclease HII [Anabaena cylindrica FACHB-243]MBY5281582.1 ribonuclease HII [Anabaena sp. CCAP 1446/1C]MBY5307164.1 ribonuclease HII [Anabaena sp. CCAP 1446/1C]MCM2409235.1 ribonuclease HII [Anabaena sp. CCAP 1446/1C]
MLDTEPTSAPTSPSFDSTAPLDESSWLEFSTYLDAHGLVAGVDEVGRGALFGPVVAATVILPANALPKLMAAKIKDSKKLSASRRTQLAQQIGVLTLDWKIGYASTAEIDKLNILQATLLAMKRAVLKLKVQPTICLVDGNQLVKDLLIPQQTIVKGDERSLNIAAASIMAKVWRDDLVLRLASKYPMYDLEHNKGYGSQRHLLALQQYGPSPLHRLSFRPCQIK